MNTRKCDLCKEAAFVPLPDWTPKDYPVDWTIVELCKRVSGCYPVLVEKLLLCPFCVAVAREVQLSDLAGLPLASSGLGYPPGPESVRPGDIFLRSRADPGYPPLRTGHTSDDWKLPHKFWERQGSPGPCGLCGKKLLHPIHHVEQPAPEQAGKPGEAEQNATLLNVMEVARKHGWKETFLSSWLDEQLRAK